MAYPDSKHPDSLGLGELYQELIRLLVLRLFGLKLHFYHTREQQYTIGETEEGIEVKLDTWISKTRRLSIEVGEKTRAALPHFTPSGIMRADNTVWYAQGDMKRAWVLRKRDLRQFFRDRRPPIIDNDPPTIQKFYLPIAAANEIATYQFNISPFVCDYGMEPVPAWANCEPCPLFSGGNCQSVGATLWRAFRAHKQEAEA